MDSCKGLSAATLVVFAFMVGLTSAVTGATGAFPDTPPDATGDNTTINSVAVPLVKF